jgi:hypothetical protein
MKRKFLLSFAIVTLLLAGLACSSVGDILQRAAEDKVEEIGSTLIAGAGDIQKTLTDLSPEAIQETALALATEYMGDFDMGGETEWPLPEPATDVIVTGDTTIFQTSLTVQQVVDFYRAEFSLLGYTEQEGAVITSLLATINFKGHPSGKTIILTVSTATPDTTNVVITLQDL